MTKDEIVELYQSNLNMTLRELSRITGWPVSRLKSLLLDELED